MTFQEKNRIDMERLLSGGMSYPDAINSLWARVKQRAALDRDQLPQEIVFDDVVVPFVRKP